MSLELRSTTRAFGGELRHYEHASTSTSSRMRFAIYLPPQALAGNNVDVLYWLSGLTCSDENFMQKAGAQRVAAKLGIAIVAPDTSPRGEAIADDDAYDLGQGAGFYVNATQTPWSQHFQMYDYVVAELPQLIESNFSVTAKKAISGHSMGGHGALMIALRNPEKYISVSAFSPISNPTQCPWGHKAFSSYLGDAEDEWQAYDSTLLVKNHQQPVPALVDYGDADEFLESQLGIAALREAVTATDYPLELRAQSGYDHSYYFIATFIEQHLLFHKSQLDRVG